MRLRKRELERVDNKDDDCEGEQDRVKEDKDGEKTEDYESEYENEEDRESDEEEDKMVIMRETTE